MDRNDYYGGDSASLNLTQVSVGGRRGDERGKGAEGRAKLEDLEV